MQTVSAVLPGVSVMDISRRKFCACFASTTFFAHNAKADDGILASCNLDFNSEGENIDKRTIRHLIPQRDDYANALIMVAADVSALFDIEFELALYDDADRPNAAFSSDKDMMPASNIAKRNADGVILLGINFISELRRLFYDLSAPLSALCAHEAGHALQNKHKLKDWQQYSINVEDENYQDRYELCADFVCGYYGAYRQAQSPAYPAAIQAVTQFSKGDKKPLGHGTPQQRATAVEAGYRFGKEGVVDGASVIEAGRKFSLGVVF